MEPGTRMTCSDKPLYTVFSSKSLKPFRRSKFLPRAVRVIFFEWKAEDVQLFLNSGLEQLTVENSSSGNWTSRARETFFNQAFRLKSLRYMVLNNALHIHEFHRMLRVAPCSQSLVSLTLNEVSFDSRFLYRTVKGLK